jgi:hypothetical protein
LVFAFITSLLVVGIAFSYYTHNAYTEEAANNLKEEIYGLGN